MLDSVKGFMPVYIEKVEFWAGNTHPSLTHTDNRIVLLSLSKV